MMITQIVHDLFFTLSSVPPSTASYTPNPSSSHVEVSLAEPSAPEPVKSQPQQQTFSVSA